MAEGSVLVDDVEEIIMPKLAVKSLLKFRCVSTKWRYRMSGKRFAQRQYKLARRQKTVNHRLIIIIFSSEEMKSLELQAESASIRELPFPFRRRKRRCDQVTLLGSGNGLVCASLKPHKNFYIWNPSTAFFRKLPNPDFSRNFLEEEEDNVDFTVDHYGCGCVASSDEYKLLIGFRIFDSDVEEFKIFSSITQRWSDISDPPEGINWISLRPKYVSQGQGVLTNEKLHRLSSDNNGLLAFDLENDKFRTLSLPNFDDNDDSIKYANLLGVSCEGRLYVLTEDLVHESIRRDRLVDQAI